MWTYSQGTGELCHNGDFVGTGYSGTGDGRNNPALQKVKNVGPIPRGTYSISTPYNSFHLGPCVMALEPLPGVNTFDRSAFRIHGNNRVNDASHGCIVLGPLLREAIAHSTDKELEVVT